jgi:hypothetical protein
VRDVVELVGTSIATQESVPAAFAILALHPDDPWQACLTAESLGGDSDTIAAVPEHQLVVAIGSVPTGDMGLDASDMWLWVNDVIVPALG